MKILFYSFFISLFGLGSSFAQSPQKGKVSGAVLEENNKAAEFVTMMLLKSADSSLVKGAVTDVEGKYEFENVTEGKYLVAASMVGYKKLYSKTFSVNESNLQINLPVMQMEMDAKNLKEVVVVGQKPFIEQKLDKTVVNVENSIVSSGGTAMEVLEKAPGVMIDKDDKISLKGKQGVIILIDGKQTYLSAAEVSNMLRNMQSNGIEQIEIITNPSAKYDAAGNSGIINIKLKKNKNMGMNGNLTAGAGYGRLPKSNGSLNLNYRNGKVNVFGNYNYGYNERFNITELDRVVNFMDTTTYFHQYNRRTSRYSNNSYKVGLDYYMNKKNTFGFMANGFMNGGTANITNNTDINDVWAADGVMQNRNRNVALLNNTDNSWKSMAYNVNYKRTFDSTDRELTVDLDYSKFMGQGSDNIRNNYFNSVGEETQVPLLLKSNIPSDVDIKSFKADYIHPLGKKAKFEAGVKSSYVITDNDVKFDLFEENRWIVDTTKTNHFKYTENINAAYINFSKELSKIWSLQLGLRAEQTISSGNSITLNKVVDRNYLEFFPSVFLSQKVGKNHQLAYSYSRRIDRPSYQDLNPFVYFLDLYTYFQGNPFLKPQFTNSFQVSHTYKGGFTTSLGYSHTRDIFTQVTIQDDETQITRATMTNLDTRKNYNLGLSMPIPIAKWWSTNNNVNVFYNQFQSNFLGEELDNSQLAMNINTNHTFILPKDFTAELSGFYNSPFVEGILRGKSMYAVGFGLQKSFMNKKASLKLNVNDIFNMMRFRGAINYSNMDLKILNKWESRQARVTFTYRFGKSDVKPARRRATGTESEQDRIKMGN